MQLIVLVFIAANIFKGKGCTESPVPTSCLRANDPRDIPFEDLGAGERDTLSSGSQVIATSYQFTCCGNVTQWRTFVDPGREGDGGYHINFQVWRLPANVDSINDGCYSLVGENKFNDIILGQNGEVCASVPPDEQITVQPGDVVGFFQQHNSGGNRGIQFHQMYSQESVWFQVDPQPTENKQCQFSVGQGKILQEFTEHAPVLSVAIESFPCGSTTTKVLKETTVPTEELTTKHVPLHNVTTTKINTLIQTTAATQSSKKVQESLNSSSLENSSSSLPPENSEFTTNTIRSTVTRDPAPTDPIYRQYIYVFIASIVSGSTSAILFVLLVVTCILLKISHMKNRKREKSKLNEKLDICDSLIYNDLYMELKKGQCRLSSGCGQESFRYPPAVPIILPFPATGGDSRYTLNSRAKDPHVYPPLPPNQDPPSNGHYVNTNNISVLSRSNSYSSLTSEPRNEDNNMVMPYAVTDSYHGHFSQAVTKHDVISTTSNAAYNAFPQHLK